MRSCEKCYVAVVLGKVDPKWDGQTVKFGIENDDSHDFKMKVGSGAIHVFFSINSVYCLRVFVNQVSESSKAKKSSTIVEIKSFNEYKGATITKLILRPITGPSFILSIPI